MLILVLVCLRNEAFIVQTPRHHLLYIDIAIPSVSNDYKLPIVYGICQCMPGNRAFQGQLFQWNLHGLPLLHVEHVIRLDAFPYIQINPAPAVQRSVPAFRLRSLVLIMLTEEMQRRQSLEPENPARWFLAPS